MSSRKTIGAVILAAGESRRMGHPKALAKIKGQTFLSRVIHSYEAAGITLTVVVLGANANEIISTQDLKKGQFIINVNFRDGQFSSFQTGLRRLDSECNAVFLALVDQPQIPSEVITQLIQTHRKFPEKIIIPTAFGKRGHPTIFPKALFQHISGHPRHGTARDIISGFESRVVEFEVADERILWNINDKKELREVEKRLNLKEETWQN